MSTILPYLLNALLYGVLAAYLLHTRWSAKQSVEHRPAELSWREHWMVLIPLALHTSLLVRSAYAPDGLYLGVGNSVSAILWLTVLIYWIGHFFYRLDGLQLLVLPVAALAALLPAVFPSVKPIPSSDSAAFTAHLLMAVLAYSLFTIASLHVLLMAMLEKRLHRGALPPWLSGLPPLLTMETLLFRIIWAGFLTLTLTLASGIVFSEEMFGRAARFEHKTLFGFISWFVFAALLAGRHWRGWRGRIAVRWTLAGFLLLILAYLGSKFVLEVLLGRA
jgi:ABC-type uncharacterized transport system permease subunit